MKYNIGQVVYGILNDKGIVYPYLIVEEQTKRTLNGVNTEYIAQAGLDKESLIQLSKIENAEFFTSLDEVKQKLMNNALMTVDAMLSDVNAHAQSWYNVDSTAKTQSQETSIEQTPVVGPDNDHDEIRVDLGNGMIGKLKRSANSAL